MVRAFGGALLTLVSLPALAGTFTAFGPQTYTRDTAAPVETHYGFSVKNPAVPYRLRVENGAGSSVGKMVASAIIKINGVTVLGTNEFNAAKADFIEAPVTVARTNDLSIELRSDPGSAMTVRILGEDSDLPSIHALVRSPNAAGWYSRPVMVTFVCSDATTPITQCTAPVTLSNDGANQTVTGTAVDSASNSASASITVSLDQTAPAIALGSAVAVVSDPSFAVSGTVTDSGSGPASVTCNGAPVPLTAGAFRCSATLADGSNVVEIVATDVAGNTTRNPLAVRLDRTPPTVRISSPADATTVPGGSVTIAGTAIDDDQIASVTIAGTAAVLNGSQFSGAAALAEGSNSITVTAFDRSGNQASVQVHVNRYSTPAVAITAPADQSVVSSPTVTISGTVSDPAATVRVNGTNGVVSGSTWRVDGVPLQQGRTVVTVTATNAAGHVATATIFVYRDSIPPRVTVYSPAEGATVYAPAVDVTGMVDDIVVGTINAGQARITVNGTAAEVANRAFVARDVTLAPGPNSIVVTATDQGGNATTVTTHVTYSAAAQAKVVKVSGDNQRGVIASTLPAPLTVRLVDAAGAPVANRAVTFEVVENNGSLTAGDATGRVVTLSTNAQGQASAVWHIGTRAGAGNNRCIARAAGFAGNAEFEAIAASGTPSLVVIDAGSNQIGAFGEGLPRPLIAAVVDAGSNRIAGVPVTFSVVEGDATFGGAPQVTVTTDSDGRAWATPLIGTTRNNSFAASIAGAARPAVFVATGKAAGPPTQTKISGVVLDNESMPIAGVSMRIEGTTLAVQTDAQGQFTLTSAPVGYVKLIADGSTAQRSGTWPMLEYPIYTIAGQNNTLEMPVYLLPIDVRRGIFVDETTGGTLTIPELPGFALTVAPGSATFPGGGRTGTVSVTLVHPDKMPMTPGFGQQPRFIVTIQPPGVHFDPPAALTIPNADGLAPGEITEMYSFDHDLGQFVAIGTGAVSEDGTVVRSDPGVGIIKGGWHCGGNPATSGATANCAECSKCTGTSCVADPIKASKPCKDDGDPNTEDVCENGSCVHKPVSVAIGGPGPSSGGSSSTDFRNLVVNRDEYANDWTNAVTLSPGQPVYGSPGLNGDYVVWRAYIANESMRAHVTNYNWTATGPQAQTGPGGAAATQWIYPTGISWQPGTYTITLVVTFDNGVTKTTTWTQEVGVRTQDIAVVGWISSGGVPLSPLNVHSDVLQYFPVGGFAGVSNLSPQKALTLAYLGDLAIGLLYRPLVPWEQLSYTDRIYIINFLFKYAANFEPIPDTFPGPAALSIWSDTRTRYKLFNRAQMKYLVNGAKLKSKELSHMKQEVGVTNEPIYGVETSGQYGPNNGQVLTLGGDTAHIINDGSPDIPAVLAFDNLAQPLMWNNIGSKIAFGVPYGASYDVKTQKYPTYYVYEDYVRIFSKTVPQAPNPIDNFNLNPYPPGPAPYIP